ncbi:MAG TPA: hypothetical protein VMF70_13640 [Gemmatimonadales bacterium]|nr:hypothetical protein [Gemmatimonadales bacterium]
MPAVDGPSFSRALWRIGAAEDERVAAAAEEMFLRELERSREVRGGQPQ